MWMVRFRGIKASRGARGVAQVTGREAGRNAGREGSHFPPTGESSSWYVRVERRGRGEERDVKRCRPTLHRRVRLRRGGGAERRSRSTLHRRTFSRREKGAAGGGGHPRCTDGTLPPEGLGEEGVGVVREGTFPRCTGGYRLLTRRAGRGG
jgi:hypothetical protein